MNIVATQFTLKYNSLEIYLAGCARNPKCEGCHNSELWDFNVGKDYKLWFNILEEKIDTFDLLIKNIWVLGGEPLDNNIDELENLLVFLRKFDKDIYLFTSYSIEDVPEKIKKLCDYVKVGEYNKNLRCKENENIHFGIPLATCNQKIIKVS